MSAAQFTHDSACCRFLGRSKDGEHDLYECTAGGSRTFIARYSSDGPDYYSWPEIVPHMPAPCSEARDMYLERLRAMESP